MAVVSVRRAPGSLDGYTPSTTVVRRNDTPKIGGSTAGKFYRPPTRAYHQCETHARTPYPLLPIPGFIVLIVCLVLIILISASAIFYLVRDERSSNVKRFATRRQRRYQQRHMGASPYEYNTSEQHPRSWAKRLASFLHIKNANTNKPKTAPQSKPLRNSENTWSHTGSVESWAYPATGGLRMPEPDLRQYQYSLTGRISPTRTANLYTAFSPIPDHNDPPPSSSDRLDMAEAHSPQFGRFLVERHSPSPHPTRLSVQIQAPISISSTPTPSPNTPTRLITPDPDPFHGSPRLHSMDSPVPDSPAPTGVSVRTFEGGSKFLEAL
ncbi:hypothetical protein AMATHDRAFT_83852 [Amanita thiersii Skay4041]|uniref:Uncharacterized protein n=1 Tax=Amanita thiersii Skay4041 TaxID=703135 RepID=A0A2A9NZW7_9AGAR|nr:hypothetical protein AMATHDRAFT_83852 [Amanita thiersii Skay4041]